MSGEFAARYGPWAVVAGASEGLGAAFARQLAERGLHLILVARRPDPLEQLAEELTNQYDIDTRAIPLDLGRTNVIEELDPFVDDLDVGLLVYNAAFSRIGSFFSSSIDERMTELDVNCRGQLSMLYRFAPAMVERGRGGIVLMSSMAGYQGTPMVAHYAATKAYDRVLAEGLWDELRPHGVDVLACAAGSTSTPNFVATNPAKQRGPLMAPEPVVREALDALGKRPVLIPGTANRLANVLMTRLLPRAMAIRIMGDNTRVMYPE